MATPPLSPGLWLVATPIGNLGDITLRAIAVLKSADVLVCEDTRRTRQLMDLLDIPVAGRRMLSYNDHNGAGRRPQIMAMLAEDLSVAYASDAGTPLIADPGYRLVNEAQDAGFVVHTVPGPSAVIAALTLSGLPTDRFLFAGFLPPKASARRRALETLAGTRATLVLFETARRIGEALADASVVLGPNRPAAVVREITKAHEETRRGTLQSLSEHYARSEARGECVLLIGEADAEDQAAGAWDAAEQALTEALKTLSVKDAAKMVAETHGLPRREVYARALEMRRD